MRPHHLKDTSSSYAASHAISLFIYIPYICTLSCKFIHSKHVSCNKYPMPRFLSNERQVANSYLYSRPMGSVHGRWPQPMGGLLYLLLMNIHQVKYTIAPSFNI